ncbi:hypothetical protein FQN54_009101 [Arachnomyces sp. PD_36]|nr:hypothetical protein FQN54_009101 [Arachnomyces sp. PD_36]
MHRRNTSSHRFVDLPAEVLCLILDHLQPEDLVALIQGGAVSASLLTPIHCSNRRNDDGNTILHILARQQRWEWMDSIVSKCPDISTKNHNRETPLQIAVKYGSHATVDFLLSAGASVSARCDRPDYNCTPLMLASRRGEQAIIQTLIDRGAKVSDEDCTYMQAIHWAAMEGHANAVQLLIDKGADVSALSLKGTPLHAAVDGNHLHVVQVILRSGFDLSNLNPRGRRSLPVCDAVANGHVDIVKALLNVHPILHASTLDVYGIPCLHLAASGGYKRMFKMFDLATNNEYDKTIVAEPWQEGEEERYNTILQLLIQGGANVCQVTEEGALTALHFAVMRPGRRAAELLINAGADISQRTSSGKSALMLASITGNHDIYELLYHRRIMQQSDPKHKNLNPQNPPEVKPKPSFLRSGLKNRRVEHDHYLRWRT